MAAEEATRGFADLHLHQFANLAFGGNVIWGDSSGPPADSLRPCDAIHGRRGRRDWIGNVSRALFAGASWRALLGHDTHGYPSFSGWPAWHDFSHQLAHEQMLKRAVDGGLRLVVVVALHNELLCRLKHRLHLTSDDRDAVDVQLEAAHAFEARVDAAAGGPGTGWYRIVRTPGEARAVVASGRLAVVLGVEVDNIFGGYSEADLTPELLSAAVERYYQAGVRHVIPLHFRDNAFGGAAFALPLHWSRNSGVISAANPVPSLPVYRMTTDPGGDSGYRYRGGRCNTRGLTPLGHRLVRELMARGMLIDTDHMSARTRSDVLGEAEREGCAVVAGHTEFLELSRPELRSERQLRRSEVSRIRDAGGVAVPLLRQLTVAQTTGEAGTAESFMTAFRHAVTETGSPWMGFGSDINGFAGLPRPGTATTVTYPFTNPGDGTPTDRSALGDRTFDLNRDGVAHLGMVPDFLAGLVASGYGPDIERLMRSASGYITLWERAFSGTGVP
jgi:microsomal dipeptidase-like Zn-dependent dipeptidase